MSRIRIPTVIVVLLAASQGFAQPYAYPPYPPPAYMPPPPTREEIDALAHAGRQKLIGGNVLLWTGGGLVLTGTALLIASIAVEDHACVSYNDHYAHDGFHAHCTNAALAWSGGTTTLFGVAAMVPGFFLRARGARELRAARAWQANAWSIRPRIGTHGALAEASVRF